MGMTFVGALQVVYYLLIGIASFWSFAGLFAIGRTRHTTRALAAKEGGLSEPVTVLKPLCGADDNLERNLRTFFEQDYEDLELVFGVKGETDPAIEVVRKLQRQYPQVRSQLVVHNLERGLNPKVSNLRAMMSFVHTDLVVISDSNIRVQSGYVRELVETKRSSGAALVTNLIRGYGRRTFGARMDALHLNAEIAAGAAIPTVLGNHPMVGKSMLFRLSTLQELGGLASVAHILAEDYVIGRMFHEAGQRIVLAPTPIENDCGNASVSAFFQRHLRWGMIRLRMQPLAFVLEPLSKPWFIAMLAPVGGVPLLAAAVWALTLSTVRDWTQAVLLGGRVSLFDIPASIVRDIVAIAAWFAAPFRRHIRWRQTRVRVSAGTRLYSA